jgi:hypothetical protein
MYEFVLETKFNICMINNLFIISTRLNNPNYLKFCEIFQSIGFSVRPLVVTFIVNFGREN